MKVNTEENTLQDLKDCYENMDDTKKLSASEKKSRLCLIQECRTLADDYEDEL